MLVRITPKDDAVKANNCPAAMEYNSGNRRVQFVFDTPDGEYVLWFSTQSAQVGLHNRTTGGGVWTKSL